MTIPPTLESNLLEQDLSRIPGTSSHETMGLEGPANPVQSASPQQIPPNMARATIPEMLTTGSPLNFSALPSPPQNLVAGASMQPIAAIVNVPYPPNMAQIQDIIRRLPPIFYGGNMFTPYSMQLSTTSQVQHACMDPQCPMLSSKLASQWNSSHPLQGGHSFPQHSLQNFGTPLSADGVQRPENSVQWSPSW